MKIKLICAALALLTICVSLAGCGVAADPANDTADAYELCSAAEKKTNSVDGYSAGVEIKAAIEVAGYGSYDVSSTAKMTADLKGEVYSQVVDNDFAGTGVHVENYYADGTVYSVTPEGSYKRASDAADAMSSARSVAAFDFTADWFADASVTKGDDGSYAVTAKPPVAALEQTCDSYLAVVDNFVGEENEYTISAVALTVKIDPDGCISSFRLDFNAAFDGGSFDGSSAVVGVNIEYYDLTGSATPTPPDGYLDFPDYADFVPETTSDTADEFLNDQDAEAIDAAFALFEDDHVTPVVGFAEKYAAACEKYGKDNIDSIIAVIQMFGSAANGN